LDFTIRDATNHSGDATGAANFQAPGTLTASKCCAYFTTTQTIVYDSSNNPVGGVIIEAHLGENVIIWRMYWNPVSGGTAGWSGWVKSDIDPQCRWSGFITNNSIISTLYNPYYLPGSATTITVDGAPCTCSCNLNPLDSLLTGPRFMVTISWTGTPPQLNGFNRLDFAGCNGAFGFLNGETRDVCPTSYIVNQYWRNEITVASNDMQFLRFSLTPSVQIQAGLLGNNTVYPTWVKWNEASYVGYENTPQELRPPPGWLEMIYNVQFNLNHWDGAWTTNSGITIRWRAI